MHVCLFAFMSKLYNWFPNSDSLSLLIQSYIPTCVLVCLCMYIFDLFLFVLLSIPYSWLPNSLFLLDTVGFFWTATSCRPCRRTFLPGFRLRECASFSWLSESVDFLSSLDMYLLVFLVLLVCLCVCLCHGVNGSQIDTVERLAK
jgi:hypothetical protein